MGLKATKTVEWLKATKLTPVQLIYVVVALFAFTFMATDIFAELPGLLKVGIYGTIMVIGVLLGVSFVNLKQLAQDMKAIYTDKSMTAEQKVNAYGNLALQILYKFGEAFEIFQNEQFEDLKSKEIEILKAKIATLEEQ